MILYPATGEPVTLSPFGTIPLPYTTYHLPLTTSDCEPLTGAAIYLSMMYLIRDDISPPQTSPVDMRIAIRF